MTNRQNPSVVIIGAGMTGIMLVIKLREAGITNITLLEKRDNIGGTWRENRYPGVACDVPSHAYTYSFAPNPEWSGMIAPGSEIQAYFEKVYRDYKVDEVTHFNEAVSSCVYDDETGQWTVKTSQDKTYTADLLYSATGILHKPVIPEFKGADTFKGDSMHSAEWKDDYDFRNKRIGVIGNGSSAVQLIPELINTEGTQVTVFQRTPQWIIELPNKPYTEKQKAKFRKNPKAMQRIKDISLWVYAKGTTALVSDKWFDRIMHRMMAWNGRHYLKKAIKDPVLREKLTPDYKFGCKRVVMNETFYPAIQKPNAHLETSGIEQFEENGIRTKDGNLHELDVVIYATGFDPAAFMRPMEFIGKNGTDIEKVWERKFRAYMSVCIPGFPNFFCMLGPNSPIGNFSVIAMSEVQAEWTIKLIKAWQKGEFETIEAREDAMLEWHGMLKSKMGSTVWASGCQSWYLDADGDPLTWPDTWKAWLKVMQEPKFDDFKKA